MKKLLLIIVAAMLAMMQSAFAYDFSAVAPNGQTLYYTINGSNVTVSQNDSDIPTGDLVIPASVTEGSTTYSVTAIGRSAFSYCSGLTSVAIPGSVTYIGNCTFGSCTSFTSIECLATVPPAIGNSCTFSRVPTDIPVYVPCGKVADYQAAEGWNRFTNIQEVSGCSTTGTANVSVYADGNDIVVEGADGNTVTLYDNASNVLSTSTAPNGAPLRFEALANGNYFIKIGVLPVKMKVVIGE